ncbi:hypothetical protein BH09PLA1_BH09PLA1_01580 [soil metagenome]
MRPRSITLCFVVWCVLAGCLRMGDPTPQERQQLQKWGDSVSDSDRAEVRHEADKHTEWMERKKTQWMIAEYRSRYAKAKSREDRRAAATQRAATQRAAPRDVR